MKPKKHHLSPEGDALRAAIVTVALVFLIVAAVGLLGGCTRAEPATPVPFVTTAQPEIPGECLAPATPEPKLKKGVDAEAKDAAVDRNNLKWAFRQERNLRAACGTRLKAERGEIAP